MLKICRKTNTQYTPCNILHMQHLPPRRHSVIDGIVRGRAMREAWNVKEVGRALSELAAARDELAEEERYRREEWCKGYTTETVYCGEVTSETDAAMVSSGIGRYVRLWDGSGHHCDGAFYYFL